MLLLKIVLFGAMVGIAAVNRYRLTPQLPAPAAMRALQRNSLAETALGAGVLLFVGALGTMSPTAHMHSQTTEIPPDAAFVHIHTSEAMADVTIDPGRTGTVTATIRVSREDFPDYVAKDVKLALDPPARKAVKFRRAACNRTHGGRNMAGYDRASLYRNAASGRCASSSRRGGQPIVLDAPIIIER